jgi:hypothetical protein
MYVPKIYFREAAERFHGIKAQAAKVAKENGKVYSIGSLSKKHFGQDNSRRVKDRNTSQTGAQNFVRIKICSNASPQ